VVVLEGRDVGVAVVVHARLDGEEPRPLARRAVARVVALQVAF
jgi:hypothetical protein